jgi:hypothetical protein
MIQISKPSRARSGAATTDLGPRLSLTLSVTIDCELLEGDVADLERIVSELAGYLERRDQHIGMIAATDWALLVRGASVRPKGIELAVSDRSPRSQSH